jgi:hypothetical protein
MKVEGGRGKESSDTFNLLKNSNFEIRNPKQYRMTK